MNKVLITVAKGNSILRVDSDTEIQYVEVVVDPIYSSDISDLYGPYENDMTITEAGFEDLFECQNDKELIKNIKWFDNPHSLSREDEYLRFLDQIQSDLADYQNEKGIGMMNDDQWQQLFVDRVKATMESFEYYKQNR